MELTKDGVQKELNKSANGHYSCEYNGIGSSSLSVPWYPGSMVYDIGGDLLIDRFELGCNWTRGDDSQWESGDEPMPDPQSPDSYADYDGSTKGCVAKSYYDDIEQEFPLDEYPIGHSARLTDESGYEDMRRARKR